jgi:glycosyltransferase involved in cell wall biosynthesis
MTTPLVSIMCLTYNHASFIRQCLDGFIMQKTSFPIEAVIHDDASTDGTADIIREYEKKYPDIIKPIYQEENQYSKGLGILTQVFLKLRGKYIAWCEGDDYWTDENKLQKQIDFLEVNGDFSICFHEVKILKENELIDDYITPKVSDVTDIYDLAKGNFMHTPSVVYRKNEQAYKDFAEFGKMPVGDYPLHMLNARYGKIKKFSDVMAVYRVGVGVWSSAGGEFIYTNWLKLLDILLDFFKNDEKIIFALTYQYGQTALHLCDVYKNKVSILEKELISLRNSRTFFVGRIILKPLVVLRNIFRNIKSK